MYVYIHTHCCTHTYARTRKACITHMYESKYKRCAFHSRIVCVIIYVPLSSPPPPQKKKKNIHTHKFHVETPATLPHTTHNILPFGNAQQTAKATYIPHFVHVFHVHPFRPPPKLSTHTHVETPAALPHPTHINISYLSVLPNSEDNDRHEGSHGAGTDRQNNPETVLGTTKPGPSPT